MATIAEIEDIAGDSIVIRGKGWYLEIVCTEGATVTRIELDEAKRTELVAALMSWKPE